MWPWNFHNSKENKRTIRFPTLGLRTGPKFLIDWVGWNELSTLKVLSVWVLFPRRIRRIGRSEDPGESGRGRRSCGKGPKGEWGVRAVRGRVLSRGIEDKGCRLKERWHFDIDMFHHSTAKLMKLQRNLNRSPTYYFHQTFVKRIKVEEYPQIITWYPEHLFLWRPL